VTPASTLSSATAPGRTRANALTVDVEEWFHICGAGGALARDRWTTLPSRVVSTTRMLLEDFDRTNARATFFVLGWVAERYPSLVAEIRAAGHDVGSHGYWHARVYELDAEAFVADLRQSLSAIRGAGAADVTAFRAPEWSINDRSLWALDLLAREGITIDASMAPVRILGRTDYPRRPYVRATAAGPLLEVPPLVADRFGQVMPLGWGWGLRMSSPRRVLRTIAAANRAGQPAVLMVHPWEIDPDPPRVPLPPALRFAHYFRLSGFRARLSRVLAGAEFGALADLPRSDDSAGSTIGTVRDE
jgi:polysaccharide deacetylase family protein (PEP-CTERM system associated)